MKEPLREPARASGQDADADAGGRGGARRHIAFVGGVDRIERQIVAHGAAVGVEVEVHSGRTSGQSTERIAALVHRTDLVVIVTGTNSHNAVRVAKREATRAGVPVHIVTFCGAAQARALVALVAAGSAHELGQGARTPGACGSAFPLRAGGLRGGGRERPIRASGHDSA